MYACMATSDTFLKAMLSYGPLEVIFFSLHLTLKVFQDNVFPCAPLTHLDSGGCLIAGMGSDSYKVKAQEWFYCKMRD